MLEMVVVVAIIGIAATIAVITVRRSRNEIDVRRSGIDLRAQIENVRALASVAGSRLGTARINYGVGCTVAAGNQLWITVDPGANTVTLPVAVAYNAANDTLDVTCRNWDWGTQGRANRAQFVQPAAPIIFSFTSNGRVTFPNGVAPIDVFLTLRHATEARQSFGLRVLPAGILCRASAPLPTPNLCDEDV